jgi:hypothetical protein
MDQGWTVGTILAGCSLFLGLRAQQEYSSSTFAVQEALIQTVDRHAHVEPEAEQEGTLFTDPVWS